MTSGSKTGPSPLNCHPGKAAASRSTPSTPPPHWGLRRESTRPTAGVTLITTPLTTLLTPSTGITAARAARAANSSWDWTIPRPPPTTSRGRAPSAACAAATARQRRGEEDWGRRFRARLPAERVFTGPTSNKVGLEINWSAHTFVFPLCGCLVSSRIKFSWLQ